MTVLVGLFAILTWLGLRFFVPGALGQGIGTLALGDKVADEAPCAPVAPWYRRSRILARRARVRARRLSRRRDWLLASGSLLLILTVVAVLLRMNAAYRAPTFQGGEYQESRRIQQVLVEDKLVPPPPLPPSAFADVIAERPSLAGADRNWNKLEPSFSQVVLHLMQRMNTRGYQTMLLEGCRSPERQDRLASQSTTVTKAKGGQSRHQYGFAADIAFVRNGKVVISERDPWAMSGYQALGEEARAAGLTWGGVWSFKDYGHIEQPGSLKVLEQMIQQEGRHCI
ncbi:M15 family metallopeptidase [Paludibacterium purpuratum]|uniref:M15 family metallopeptidase n=1 Tax=Paludibacterium purpuratum TaxID=1144873 RepID=UPI001FB7094D|nr:M15 family metallopeptidase [Paludibacterium purpuratum]